MQPQGEQVSENSQIKRIIEEDNRQVLLSKFKRYKKEISKEENKTNLDRYLDEEDNGDFASDFNVLIWWKLNSHKFPILSNMARDVLAAPISTVASESAFSTGERVLDAYRSSLTPRLVQALICAQDWLRGSLTFNDIEDDLAEFEKVDLGK